MHMQYIKQIEHAARPSSMGKQLGQAAGTQQGNAAGKYSKDMQQ
jgi:hypothetical protein